MEKDARILIAGHEGMIGSAILSGLRNSGFSECITRTFLELDLTDQRKVLEFFITEKPDYVFLVSSKTGGILANSRYPADYIYINLTSQTNVIHSSWKSGVKKLLFLGSSCIYPLNCPQPMKEESLLDGKMEPISEPYAIAKIAGIRMCQSYNLQHGTDYICAIPADAYGPNDDFDPETSHVLPALMSKMHKAKTNNEAEVKAWGTGSPRREALHVDDLADACIFLMNHYSGSEIINIGTGEDISIKKLAGIIKIITGFNGNIVFDKSKFDGTPRKLLDISRISELGWSPKVPLNEGLRETYEWFSNQFKNTLLEKEK
ncbi:GDP-L-fucose synthase family protein [Chloroflexota bacterium]